MTISSFSKHQRTWLRWCPALCCAIIIFYFSSMPGDEVEKTYNSLDTIAQPASTTSATVTATAQAAPKATATAKPPAATVTTTFGATATTMKATPTATALPISGMVRKIPIFSTLDLLKAGHAIGYFWLGWMVLYALSLQSRRSPTMAVALCALYAVSDEFHQRFVPGRSAAVRDVLIDTLASLVGVAALFALVKIWAFFRQRRAPAG